MREIVKRETMVTGMERGRMDVLAFIQNSFRVKDSYCSLTRFWKRWRLSQDYFFIDPRRKDNDDRKEREGL